MSTFDPGHVVADRFELVRPWPGGDERFWEATDKDTGGPVFLARVGASSEQSFKGRHLLDPTVVLEIPEPISVWALPPGELLSTRLARETVLSTMLAAAIVRQVAAAIGDAHEKGLAHGRLSPTLVYLAQRDGEVDVRVLAPDGFRKVESLNRHAMPVEGLRYLSPEQLEPLPGVSPASDQWSIAVIAHELLDTQLFEGTREEVTEGILSGWINAPGERRHALQPYNGFFKKALERKAAARFGTLQGAVDAFRHATAQAEVSSLGGAVRADSVPPGAAGATGQPNKSFGRAQVAMIVVLVVMTLLLFWYASGVGVVDSETSEPTFIYETR